MDKTENKWMLTTIDNPWSPFTDYWRWYNEDVRLGHDTCGLLDRFLNGTTDFDEEESFDAMSSIVRLNFSNKHVMVVPSDFNPKLKVELFVDF